MAADLDQGPATPAEAAAVSAAIERFLGDTAVAPPAGRDHDESLAAGRRWSRAVEAKNSFGPGDPRELS